ncbi:DUF3261 domain-containing protein [Kushneria phosphatilytica]|nr:DUF3261 domain-containing protein [Kushneria phosphatilytica]OHV10633.1 hypothetical protein BH688_09135 [Kushneria phosphatilytica]
MPNARLTLYRLVIVLLTLWLGGCVGPPLSPSPDLHAHKPSRTLVKRIEFVPFAHPEQAKTLIAAIRRASDGLRVVVTTPTGQRLLTLVHDDQGARYTQTLMPADPPFPAIWLAQRLEWGLWPLDSLQHAFAGSHWQVSERPNGRGTIRRIEHNHRLIVRVDRWPSHDVLTDYSGDYRLTITPLSDTPEDRQEIP